MIYSIPLNVIRSGRHEDVIEEAYLSFNKVGFSDVTFFEKVLGFKVRYLWPF